MISFSSPLEIVVTVSGDKKAAGNADPRDWSGMALTIGGVGAAFAAAACCGLPIALGAVGLGSAWLFGLARVAAPHRIALLITASLLLAAGVIATWQQSKRFCQDGRWCSRRSVKVATWAGLLVGVLLLALGYVYG